MSEKQKRWARQDKRRNELGIQKSFGMAYRVGSMRVMREIAAMRDPTYRSREFGAPHSG